MSDCFHYDHRVREIRGFGGAVVSRPETHACLLRERDVTARMQIYHVAKAAGKHVLPNGECPFTDNFRQCPHYQA